MTIIFGLILSASLVFGMRVDWEQMKQGLRGPQPKLVAKEIVKHWSVRPTGFFKEVEEESWRNIIALLSWEQMKEISPEEFKGNNVACKVFAENLPRLSKAPLLPVTFRLAVYDLLSHRNSDEMLGVLKCIPSEWVKKDGPQLMKVLMLGGEQAPHIKNLNDEALAVLFENPGDSCKLITLDLLKSLTPKQLKHVKPGCMSVINNLESMNLSEEVQFLPDNVFSNYNGALSKETIRFLSCKQLNSYGILVPVDDAETICESLELSNSSPLAIECVTSRCLYGYLAAEKREFGLGVLWERIPITTIMEFTPLMQQSWANIQPTDFPLMPFIIRNVIFSKPYACTNVHISRLDWTMMADISAVCLYSLLSNSSTPVKLGVLWNGIQPRVLSAFTEDMMRVFENVDVSDVVFMPFITLQFFLQSEAVIRNLSKALEATKFHPSIEKLVLTKQTFALIARMAPRVAGQLLLTLESLPDDILADCDGNVLRTLTVNTFDSKLLNWSFIFEKLEGKQVWFDHIVFLMSKNTEIHLCKTIKDLEEYLSLSWLRRNMNEACRSVLSFEVNDIFSIAKAPELVSESSSIPWEGMLKEYKPEDWRSVFSNKRFATVLGKNCDFWSTINREHKNVISYVHPNSLKRIKPACIIELKDVLHDNVRLIPFLADDAFSIHRNGELPCELNNLSPQQIAKLSTYTTAFKRELVEPERVSPHIVSGLTFEMIESLHFKQFQSLFESQWAFVPKEIKIRSLGFHFEAVTNYLNARVKTFYDNEKAYYELAVPANSEDLEVLEDALELYAMIKQSSCEAVDNLKLFGLLSAISKSNLRDHFVKLFQQSSWLNYLSMSLIQNADELRNYLQLEFGSGRGVSQVELPPPSISLNFDAETGFDRAALHSIIHSSPNVFASPGAFLTIDLITDQGGPLRMLVSQLLSDIGRDLIVPGPQVTSHKFVWGISQRAGFIVGLTFAKALQLDMQLTFCLDPLIYFLLIDSNDQTIEKYHAMTYSQDMLLFKRRIISLRGQEPLPNEQLLYTLTRPENLRFTTLSLQAEGENAKNDWATKTNVNGCGNLEGFDSIEEFKDDNFLDSYFETIGAMILAEFKAFIHEFLRGFSECLPLLGQFAHVPPPALYPFAVFLPTLLNSKPINRQIFIKRIEFDNDSTVQSLITGQQVAASKIITAFIQSLDEEQLEHLVALWTGASTISLDYAYFRITFLEPTTTGESFKFNFCDPIGGGPEAKGSSSRTFPILPPGKRYLDFFKTFTAKLCGSTISIEPDCNPEGTEVIPIRISTCAKSLYVFLQPAQQMLNSLVDMLNTLLTSIRDY